MAVAMIDHLTGKNYNKSTKPLLKKFERNMKTKRRTIMPDVPTKMCGVCRTETPLSLVLVAENNGQSYIIFCGICHKCNLMGKRQPVFIASPISRREYLYLRGQGVPLTE